MTTRVCLFCLQPLVERAREHVIPLWLQELLGVREEELFQGIAQTEGGTLIEERRHPTRHFVEGRVCRECNNGWMATLEGAVQPLLVPLMESQLRLRDLREEERMILARWTLKTACALSYAAPMQASVPTAHCTFVRERQDSLPEGVAVFGAHHRRTGETSYLQRNTWPQFSTQRREDHPDRYKIAFQFRDLLLLAAHWPPPPVFVVADGIHEPIWPTGRYRSWDPQAAMPDPYDSRAMLARFSDTLALAHPDTF
jgi:hypothetical protein